MWFERKHTLLNFTRKRCWSHYTLCDILFRAFLHEQLKIAVTWYFALTLRHFMKSPGPMNLHKTIDNQCNCKTTIRHFVLVTVLDDGLVPWNEDVIKWKHFSLYWPFVRGIHRSPVNSPHKDQWRGALMFSLICLWINGWLNNREAGDLRRQHAHYDVTVMRVPNIYYTGPAPEWLTRTTLKNEDSGCTSPISVKLNIQSLKTIDKPNRPNNFILGGKCLNSSHNMYP